MKTEYLGLILNMSLISTSNSANSIFVSIQIPVAFPLEDIKYLLVSILYIQVKRFVQNVRSTIGWKEISRIFDKRDGLNKDARTDYFPKKNNPSDPTFKRLGRKDGSKVLEIYSIICFWKIYKYIIHWRLLHSTQYMYVNYL